MANSTGRRSSRQPMQTTQEPAKFPLYLHKSGHYAKKVRGKVHYFGKDRDTALALWIEQSEDLLAGRTIRPQGEGPTVSYICNALLTAKQTLVDSGELSPRTWEGYRAASEIMTKHFGRNRLVSDLKPADFVGFRAAIAKNRGVVSVGNVVRHVRGIFKHAYKCDLIEKPIKYGDNFSLPKPKAVRAARQARGERMFEAADLRKLIKAANEPLRAMILLAINCGFGQTDCSRLTIRSLDLVKGWHRFPRPKTAAERRCPLWPETIASLKHVLSKRHEPKDPALADRVFITVFGGEFVKSVQREAGNTRRVVSIDSIGLVFGKLLKKLELGRSGIGFYAIRHTFQTISEGAGDPVAVSHIMGHIPQSGDMAAKYRERIEDSRLIAVSEFVRQWLFPPIPKRKRGEK